MSLNDISISQHNTMLSAEAESFIPRRMMASGGPTGPGPGMQHQMVPSPVDTNHMNQHHMNQLPHYLTSCYPFVKGENTSQAPNRMGSPGGWHGPGRPPTPQYGTQPPRMPSPQAGHFGYNHLQQRCHTPQTMKGQNTNTRLLYNTMPPSPGMLPSPGTMSPSSGSLAPSPGGVPHNPGLIGHPVPGIHGPLSPSQSNVNPYIPYLHTMGLPSSSGAVWSPQVGQELPNTQYTGGQVLYPPYQYTGGHEMANTIERNKSTEKKKKKKLETASNMVSIGIQNESGVGYNSGSNSKKKTKQRTIICRHADTQTDFSDEIANMTLAEKPCPLYHKDNRSRSWLQRYQDSSTDSEEKDSDSGYSSPLHRRNQANNGTHPVVGITPYCAPGTVIPGMPILPVPSGHPISHLGAVHPGIMHPVTHAGLPPSGAAHPIVQHISGHHVIRPGAGLLPQPGTMYPQFIPTSMAPGSGYPQRPNIVGSNQAPCYPSVYQPPPVPVNSSLHLNHPAAKHDPPVSVTAPSTPAVSKPATKTTNSPLLARLGSANTEPEDDDTSSGKKKRRRSRRKKRASSSEDIGALSDEPYDMHRAHSSSNVSRTSDNDMTLHFDDEDEFPNLLSAAGGLPSSTNSQSSGPISYSDILKSHVPSRSLDSSISSLDRFKYVGGPGSQSNSSTTCEFPLGQGKESKNARKRRKRRELASRAADEELAEISFEQSVLKELRSKSLKDPISPETAPVKEPPEPMPAPAPQPKSQPAGKKSKQPISLNFADMISALEKQHEADKAKKEMEPIISHQDHSIKKSTSVANILDATAPVKRGKEREVPKVKKPSPLKKVILKEREEKKRLRLLEESNPLSPGTESSDGSQLASVAGMPIDSDLSQDGVSSKTSSMDYVGTPVSEEMSPISQTSPINMSPLSGSPLSSGVNSPIASNNVVGPTGKSSVLMKIHSRRFREYCNQVLDKDIDACCTILLQDLVRFQDRLYHKDPVKAKSKRRIVLGLREVTKHLKLNRIKCVIISPNMERIQSKGGLDEALNNILDLCTDQDIPFVFALGRRALGRACAKLVPVSVAGVFNFDGSEENFHALMSLSEKARSQYKEMVALLEKETEEAALAPRNANTTSTIGGFTQLFPHLGHSRTPSACSAISFTSSILSEPISENYPHSEPETDSRGYEIIRDKAGADIKNKMAAMAVDDDEEEEDEEEDEDGEIDSLESSQEKVIIIESLDDIGHEADTEADEEDDIDSRRKRCVSVSCAAITENNDDVTDSESQDDQDDDHGYSDNSDRESFEANSIIEKDDVQDLPHIDSIHSSSADPCAEILSQHSSKTIDLNEALSTHSSKTLEAERGYTTPDRSSKNMGSATDLREASAPGSAAGSGGSSRLRSVDNQERVQSWVTDTQKHLELIGRCEDVPEEITINNNMCTDGTKCCDTKYTCKHVNVDLSCKDLLHTDNSSKDSIQSVIQGVNKLSLTGHTNRDCVTQNGTDTNIT